MTVTELSQLEAGGALGSDGKGLGCEPAEPQKTKESQAAKGKRPLRTRSQDPTPQRSSLTCTDRVGSRGPGHRGSSQPPQEGLFLNLGERKEEKVFTDS